MTALVEMVEQVFAPGGVLARSDAHFQPRDGQAHMAGAVAKTMAQGGALVVEAGTGVGKTYAYLVPALLSGERVLLSTATKALQDQLFARDLPRLAQILGVPARTALLKGRASYVCLHRLGQARDGVVPGAAQSPGVSRVLAKVEAWSQATRTGDLAELAGLDERSPVIPLVTSTRENCLGSPCPRFRECHVHRARREALAADIVVINHHLFFADLAVRESGMAELLPSARVVVFDEAHQINETGVQFLGMQLSTGQLSDFARDVVSAGQCHARGVADWGGLGLLLERSAQALTEVAPSVPAGARLRWAGDAPAGIDAQSWQLALRAIARTCARVQEAIDLVSEASPDLERLYERGSELLARLALFAGPSSPDAVRWLEAGLQLRLSESPLDIAHTVRTRLLGAPAAGGEDDAWPDDENGPGHAGAVAGRAWIFTSATLGDDERLSWFTEPAGLQDAAVLRVASPFDYVNQAALYVPRQLPMPADPSHSKALAHWLAPAAMQLGGRTLVLTTTLKALRIVGDMLREQLAALGGAVEVLVQGEWPKRRLMERFREGEGPGKRGCVLVASATFWEGFDVPGNALQMVVIDKLPFPPPGDPLVEARVERITQNGGKAFTSYALPEAAVALKQGAGRLIRHESDQGILVVADRRLVTMGYGKRLMAALPPMRQLCSEEEFASALADLTRTSTTGQTSV